MGTVTAMTGACCQETTWRRTTGHWPCWATCSSSRVRATVLAWVAPRLETPFSLTELSRAVGSPISSLQHECYKLERLGVLAARRDGGSRRYRVQRDHQLTRPLIGLTIAAVGIASLLRDALADAGTFETALIAGPDPVAGGDLVLVLIGDAGLEGLDQAQQRVALLLGIDPDRLELAYFQADDWHAGAHALVPRLAGRPTQPISAPGPR